MNPVLADWNIPFMQCTYVASSHSHPGTPTWSYIISLFFIGAQSSTAHILACNGKVNEHLNPIIVRALSRNLPICMPPRGVWGYVSPTPKESLDYRISEIDSDALWEVLNHFMALCLLQVANKLGRKLERLGEKPPFPSVHWILTVLNPFLPRQHYILLQK